MFFFCVQIPNLKFCCSSCSKTRVQVQSVFFRTETSGCREEAAGLALVVLWQVYRPAPASFTSDQL